MSDFDSNKFDNLMQATVTMLQSPDVAKILTQNNFVYASITSMIQTGLDMIGKNDNASLYPVQISQMANYLMMNKESKYNTLRKTLKIFADKFHTDDKLLFTMFLATYVQAYFEKQAPQDGIKVIGKMDTDLTHFFYNLPICNYKLAKQFAISNC